MADEARGFLRDREDRSQRRIAAKSRSEEKMPGMADRPFVWNGWPGASSAGSHFTLIEFMPHPH
jgi:hypothetical protein